MVMKTELHIVRAGHEWAYVVADEDTGLFSAHSSFGTFAHIWPPQHRSAPLWQFLARLDLHYFAMKTLGTNGTCLDFDGSIETMKKEVLHYRRRGGDRGLARDAWDHLESIEQTNSSDYLSVQVCDSTELLEALGDDWWGLVRNRTAPECEGFWRELWPSVLAAISPAEVTAPT
jgi:hypothetical protein